MIGLLLLLQTLTAGAQVAAPELPVYYKLDQAQRLNPRDPAAAKAWLDEAARLATLAAEQIERPLSGAPSWNNLRGYAEFKVGYEDAGNDNRLVELGRSLQTINPRSELGWYLEGAGLRREGRSGAALIEAATKALRKATGLQPSHARARFLLARALQESTAGPEAIAELEQVLRLDPDHERAHYVLARLYQKTGKAEAAQREFDRHAQIKKADRNAQYRRLLIAIRDGGQP